jgi:hypothetical protein
MEDEQLKRIRLADMANIMRHAHMRRCTCGGRMVPVSIKHEFKRWTSTSAGYEVRYQCQACRKNTCFMSPLAMAKLCFGVAMAGGWIVVVFVFFPSGLGSANKDKIEAVIIGVFSSLFFLYLANLLFIQLRNRVRYRQIKVT